MMDTDYKQLYETAMTDISILKEECIKLHEQNHKLTAELATSRAKHEFTLEAWDGDKARLREEMATAHKQFALLRATRGAVEFLADSLPPHACQCDNDRR
jgi:hypothetical protein